MPLRRFALIFCCLALWSPVWAQTQVDPKSSSVEAQNVKQALEFLKNCHSSYYNAIQKAFDDGRVYVSESDDYSYSDGYQGKLVIRPTLIRPMEGKVSVMNTSGVHFGLMAQLARALVHESYHSENHGTAYRIMSNASNVSMTLQKWGTWLVTFSYASTYVGNYGVEVEAYSATIVEMDHWIECAINRAIALRKAKKHDDAFTELCNAATIARLKDEYLEEYKLRKYGNLSITDAAGKLMTVERYRKELTDLTDEITKAKKDPSPPPQPPEAPKTEGTIPTHKPGELQIPKENPQLGEVKVSWKGKGQAAGHVLDCTVENSSQEELIWPMVPGVVLKAPGAQTMILAEVSEVRVPPGGARTFPVRGFCLNYQVRPPANGQTVAYEPVPAPERYADSIRCLVGGLKLESEGKLQGSLGDQQSTTVIQRALWSVEGVAGKAELDRDLRRQVSEARLDRSDAEVTSLVNEIWNQVEGVRRASPTGLMVPSCGG